MLFKHMMFFGLCMFAADGAGGTGGAGGAGESGGNEGDESGGEGEGESGGESGDDDTAGLKSALEKERKASRDAAKALKAAQAELDKIRNAGKSEEERREADLKSAIDRATKAEEVAQKKSGEAAVFKAASESISPEAVYAIAASQLEFDDEANPTNVEDVIAAIKKSSPKLFPAAKGSADGGKSGAATGYEPSPGVARIAHAYEQNAKAAKR